MNKDTFNVVSTAEWCTSSPSFVTAADQAELDSLDWRYGLPLNIDDLALVCSAFDHDPN